MPPEEKAPRKRAVKKKTEKPEAPTAEETSEETGVETKKKPSGRKKSQDVEVIQTPEGQETHVYDFRNKSTDKEVIEVEPQARDITPTPDDDKAPDPLAVVESQPTVPLTTDELIKEAVKYINEKANQALYMGSVNIGSYILTHFYGDNIDLARSRNPVKPLSYRLLCEHPDLAIRPETLGVMLRVAAQEAFFLASKVKTQGLSYSHRAELVKILDDDVRVMLVHRVLEESLSVRQLAELVTQERKGIVSEDKPLGTYLERMINSSEKLFEDPRREALINDETRRKEQLKSLKGKTRRRLLEKVDDVMEKTKEWVKLYEGLKRDLEEIEEEKQTKKS